MSVTITGERTRVIVTFVLDPQGADGELAQEFHLVKVTEHQRKSRGYWYRDASGRLVPKDEAYTREIIGTLTRQEVAALIASAAKELAYPAL